MKEHVQGYLYMYIAQYESVKVNPTSTVQTPNH